LWGIILLVECLNMVLVILCPKYYVIILTYIRTDFCFKRELTMHVYFLSVIEYKRHGHYL